MPSGNDSWMVEPATRLIWQMRETAGENMRILEGVVALAEVASVKHPESAMVSYFLANLYRDLPEELSLEVKRFIERERLRAEGREHVLDMSDDPREYRTEEGPDIVAAIDYLHRTQAHMYISHNNSQRAVLNFNDAIKRSRTDPELYRNVLETTALSFLLDERFEPYLWTTAIALSYSGYSGKID